MKRKYYDLGNCKGCKKNHNEFQMTIENMFHCFIEKTIKDRESVRKKTLLSSNYFGNRTKRINAIVKFIRESK